MKNYTGCPKNQNQAQSRARMTILFKVLGLDEYFVLLYPAMPLFPGGNKTLQTFIVEKSYQRGSNKA